MHSTPQIAWGEIADARLARVRTLARHRQRELAPLPPTWATLLRARNGHGAWRSSPPIDDAVAIKVLAHVPSSTGRVIEEVELSGAAWRDRVDAIRALDSVHALSILESSEVRARLRLEIDAGPLEHAVSVSGVTPRFPYRVQQGTDEWLLVADQADAARFVDDLRAQGVIVDIVSSREHHAREGPTDRQRELMRIAISQGYYEVPRRVTLTRLAARLHLSKSTLSETLARGERRVLDDIERAEEPDPDTDRAATRARGAR